MTSYAIPAHTIQLIREHLEDSGICNDEQSFLTCSTFEDRSDEIIAALCATGYEGSLILEGGYYPRSGGIAYLYDKNRLSSDEASAIIKSYDDAKKS